MTFSSRPFAERLAKMGDEAEGEFERAEEKGWVRFGLNRPPIKMSELHSYVRHTPDYLTSRGWIEVMGCGAEQVLKLKHEKLAALKFWSLLMPVFVFVWDSKNKRSIELPLDRIETLARQAPVERFPEGITYAAISAEELFRDDG